jgi:hypothetical protein
MADAAVSVFDQDNGGLSSTYKRFETEIQRSLHLQLRKQTKADWKREVDIMGLSFQGSWGKSVDLALLERVDGRDVTRALLEVKVVEQYERNRSYGHEFPYIFYGAPLDAPGVPAEQHLLSRLKELGKHDTSANRDLIRMNLQRFAPVCVTNGHTQFVYAEEGALLYDFAKMISFAVSAKVPLYQIFYLLTYTDKEMNNWEHVHDSSYLQERLTGLYSCFHDVSRDKGVFEVVDQNGNPVISTPFRSFATQVTLRDLGRQQWNNNGKQVDRNVSVVVVRHDLAPPFSLSWQGESACATLDVSYPKVTVTHSAQPVAGKASLRYGVFDVETKFSAKEVGGWQNAHKMGVSIAVLYDSATDEYLTYREEEVPVMIERMQALDLVIGFNNKRFDNKVLSAYTTMNLNDLPTLDLLQAAGGRSGLDNFACHTLGAGKSGDGMDALRWFKEGKFDKIAHYCQKDVELTKGLYEHALSEGYLLYENKKGNVVRREMVV